MHPRAQREGGFKGAASPSRWRRRFRDCDLWHRYKKVMWKFPARFSQQLRQENVERADASVAQFLVERFDAKPDEWGQAPGRQPGRQFTRGGGRETVFFFVRTVAKAILKINAEILHRLPSKFSRTR